MSDYKAKDFAGSKYTIQVAPEDCTGCELCVRVCPAKDKSNPKHKSLNMAPQMPLREQERENYAFFLDLPEVDRTKVKIDVKGSQFLQPLFEYSGACEGCGETPYVKLLTQLFGDRLLIGNATGCSSIYGGNLPTTPYGQDETGAGRPGTTRSSRTPPSSPSGSASPSTRPRTPRDGCSRGWRPRSGDPGRTSLLLADQLRRGGHRRPAEHAWKPCARKLEGIDSPDAHTLAHIADYLVRKSVWAVGGDGWAYDIGYGGLDHTLAIGRDVNLLVLDTGVYSNTGGQASKATPLGAVAKFAMGGKAIPSKDLGMMAMAYGHVYVASVAFGAKDSQTVRAFLEAESYPGPSMIIAYSHCIAHGYNMSDALDHQKAVVECGAWPMYRFDPRRTAMGENPLKLDSRAPKIAFDEWALTETRFRMLAKINPERSKNLLAEAQRVVQAKYDMYQQLANLHYGSDADAETN